MKNAYQCQMASEHRVAALCKSQAPCLCACVPPALGADPRVPRSCVFSRAHFTLKQQVIKITASLHGIVPPVNVYCFSSSSRSDMENDSKVFCCSDSSEVMEGPIQQRQTFPQNWHQKGREREYFKGKPSIDYWGLK